MLLEIYLNDDHVTIVEITDNSYDSVIKAFEMIGHPEYTLNVKDNAPLEQDKDYSLYNWDDIATVMAEQGKESLQDVDLHDVADIGSVTIWSEKFIDIDLI